MAVSRTILSLYIDIPLENLVSHHESKVKFSDNYKWLLNRQQEYAKSISVDYNHFVYDQKYIDYKTYFTKTYPNISEYNIVNFYKIKLMYEMAELYDEILYLDMDVVPATEENFVEIFDLKKGYAIMTGTATTQKHIENHVKELKRNHGVRSPLAKYWSTKTMLSFEGYKHDGEVFNTGIVGITSNQLKELDYFSDFDSLLTYMKELQEDENIPDNIRKLFDYNNETIWGYRTLTKNISYQELGDYWHHFMYETNFIPNHVKLIHCVNKNFDYVKNWYEKNSI